MFLWDPCCVQITFIKGAATPRDMMRCLYGSRSARLGNKREKPGQANVCQVEVLNGRPTVRTHFVVTTWQSFYYLFLMKSFHIPITNSVAMNATPKYPIISIFALLLLYYMKLRARIQPFRAKCYGICLLSIYTRSN